MTDDQLDAIDALVAEKVMGWRQHPDMRDCWHHAMLPNCFKQKHYWKPTRSWSDAGEVADRVSEKLCAWFSISYTCVADHGMDHERCVVTIQNHKGPVNEVLARVTADGLPLAIALAALSAVGSPWKGKA